MRAKRFSGSIALFLAALCIMLALTGTVHRISMDPEFYFLLYSQQP